MEKIEQTKKQTSEKQGKDTYYGFHKPESLVDLEKMLKFRVPTWKNKEYWDWCKAQRIDGYEWHHLIGRKYYDLFLVRIPKAQHDRIHHGRGYDDGEFEELFIQSLNWLMAFINYKTEKR